MKRLVSVILALAFALPMVACTAIREKKETTPAGVETVDRFALAIGGKGAAKFGADGPMMVWQNEKSWRDTMIAAGTVAAGYYGAAATQATEATKRSVSAQAAKTQQTQITADAATKQAQIGASTAQYSEAVGAGAVPTVGTVTPVAP